MHFVTNCSTCADVLTTAWLCGEEKLKTPERFPPRLRAKIDHLRPIFARKTTLLEELSLLGNNPLNI
jgi:hypothetical protein